MRAFDRETNDLRVLRKATKIISDNVENRIAAYMQSGLGAIVLTDEATGTRYQIIIIDGEIQKREL